MAVKPLTHDPSRRPITTGNIFLAAVLTAVKTGRVTGVLSRVSSLKISKKKHCYAMLFRLTDRQDGSCDRECRHDGRQKGRFFSTMAYLYIYYSVDTCFHQCVFTSLLFRHCIMLLRPTYNGTTRRVREFDFFCARPR